MFTRTISRRALLAVAAAAALGRGVAQGQATPVPWGSAPIGWPGEVPGAGFRIRHGYACENTWFAPGWWHTGEDWYAVEGNSAGAQALAIGEGEVAYAGFDYPGHVVIVRHAEDLFAAYGHLDPGTTPGEGAVVAAGDVLGRLLDLGMETGPGVAPSHLHFEMRDFLIRDGVNGDAPQHGVSCGVQCPPGPGYWPIGAAEHPSVMGWRNPSHLRLGRLDVTTGAVAVLANDAEVAILNAPEADADVIDELASGESVTVARVMAGEEASTGTSAEAYEAWLELGSGGWVQALVPSDIETGGDGRPSALEAPLLMVAGSVGARRTGARHGIMPGAPRGRRSRLR